MNQPGYKGNSVTAHVKADYPQTAWIPPNKGTITAGVKWQLWSSTCSITWELRTSNPQVLEVTVNVIHSTSCRMHICFQMIILYTYSVCNYKTPTIW